jgi:hypothetical protein
MAGVGADTVVELFLDVAWVDVTDWVRQDPGLDIQFGVMAESGTADANTCTLVVNNADGRFSPRNTAGAYYPYLTRNTPLRVVVGGVTRFQGEVSEFPSRWEPSGADVWAPLVASGILRRLQHASALDSTLTSSARYLQAANGDLLNYWPVEDEVGSTSIASAFDGGTPGGYYGAVTPVFQARDLGPGTHNVATWGGAKGYFGPVDSSSTEFSAGVYIGLPPTGQLTGGEELFRVDVEGTALSWRILYTPALGGGVFLQVIDNGGNEVLASTPFQDLDGDAFYAMIEAKNNGANVDWRFHALNITVEVGTIVGRSVGSPIQAQLGIGTIAIPADAEVALGHIALADAYGALFQANFYSALVGYAGETVTGRLSRLAAQTGVSISVTSGGDSPTLLGAQPDGTLLDVVRAVEKADAGGILRDSISAVGLVYITRDARYNDQQPLLTLDYPSGHLSPPLEPTDDDQQLRNDVKVNRIGGSSARKVLASGALSTADYPAGVGPYPFEDSYNIYADTALPYLADWVLALGTIDETRFPAVTVDLIANSSLRADAEAIRPGSRIRITNLPAYAGAINVDLQVIGWKEHLDKARRNITFVCTPGTIWGTATTGFLELDDAVLGKLDLNRLAY